jgi:hypothetical protein
MRHLAESPATDSSNDTRIKISTAAACFLSFVSVRAP